MPERVAFVHISPRMVASFVRRDFEILGSQYEVTPVYYRHALDIPRLLHAVSVSDAVVSWFAWDHAAWAFRLADLLGKPSILITGGFDMASLPEIRYGSLADPGESARVREIVRRATRVLAISESIRASAASLSTRADIELVPLGFDPEWIPFSATKENLALTVGAITLENLARKGMGSFIDLAKAMPEIPFVLVGGAEAPAEARIRSLRLPNLVLTGRVDDGELKQWFSRAKVYVQLSAHEGFGSAVAEAMLAGCVPVVSDRGALPEVVGESGFIVPYGDSRAALQAVEIALESPPDAAKLCRERIVREFPLTKRREALLRTLRQVVKTSEHGAS